LSNLADQDKKDEIKASTITCRKRILKTFILAYAAGLVYEA